MSAPDAGRAGFDAYVAARRPALLRTAYLLTGSHHDAEDLVQTALLRVVPRWSRISAHPDPYVRRVLARESISRWRSRRWREQTTDHPPEQPSAEPDPDRMVLRAAVATLSPRQRAVLVLRYFEDLTESDTAEALGLSVGTVKSYAREGLARLRERAPSLIDADEPAVTPVD